MSFKRSDDVGEGEGDESTLLGVAFKANDNDTLGCGDSCVGIGE